MSDVDIPRDRWGRPLIVPPTGGKPIAYTRVSTLAKTLDDTEGLTRWKLRQALTGVAKRNDLLALARSNSDKQTLDRVAKDALEAAASGAAANMGTALHTWCEMVDNELITVEDVAADQRDDVKAYRAAITAAGLTPVMAEKFVVCDTLQAAGTLDRVYTIDGMGLVVGDLKTGATAADYPQNVAMQVATYAHSTTYHPTTGRGPAPLPVDLAIGVLIHLPAGQATCTIYALDITAGWDAAITAAWVRRWRRTKPISPWATQTSTTPVVATTTAA